MNLTDYLIEMNTAAQDYRDTVEKAANFYLQRTDTAFSRIRWRKVRA